ncbi:MAG: hypothetical protein KAR14_03575, partial [Candidatus Aminicenantes bacterium]|nr:hypothetical protein [Candidatus Aminicenantes bacterium]
IRSASESSHFRKLLLRRYYHLKGLVQKKRKKYKEAVDYFLKGVDLSSHEWGSSSLFNENSALFYFELGHSYFLSGQLFESEKWLRKLGYLTLSRYFFGDLYAKSLYYLGKIFQKKGWVGKAIESYDHFILMWGNGDREIVGEMITDAEKQVKLLETKI